MRGEESGGGAKDLIPQHFLYNLHLRLQAPPALSLVVSI